MYIFFYVRCTPPPLRIYPIRHLLAPPPHLDCKIKNKTI